MKPLRVFIAEDEAIIMLGFKTAIEKMGFYVAGIAINGNEALKKIKNLKPDIILMDINLPEKDGLSVIEELNREIVIPVIIITGYYSQDLVKRANSLGIFNYLIKPVDNNQLSAAINIAMQRYFDFKDTIEKNESLKQALDNRIYIEKAKGIIMNQQKIPEDEAMKKLQKMSKDKNIKLVAIAKKIIEVSDIFSGKE